MHIAIDIRCLMDRPLTGIGLYTLNLLTALFKTDTTNQYFLFYSGLHKNTVPLFEQSNVHYCFVRMPNKLLAASTILFIQPKLNRLIERKMKTTIDLMFFPNLNFIAVDCPYIITAHDLSFALFPEFFSKKQQLWHKLINPQRVFHQAQHVFAVSQHTKHDLEQTFAINPEKITTIYPGLDPASRVDTHLHPRMMALQQEYTLPKKFILFLGTQEPRKNLDSVISAFASFAKENKQVDLVIFGKSSHHAASLKKSIARSGVGERIHVHGYVNESDKPFLFALATAFVFPSLYEGFGFPPLEALAQGCPVIVGANSSLSEIVGETAIVVNPNSVTELARAMDAAIIQPRKIPVEVLTTFSWDKAAFDILHQMQEGNTTNNEQ